MIFQSPWAWIGAAAIAVPILVHLLTRRRVDRTPFPTLRFLPVLPLTTVRRYRLTDLVLLAVRCGVLLAATFALAQPYVITAARRHDSAIARAVVLDTSGSMSRLTSTGVRAVDAARASIVALEPRADATTTVESGRLRDGIAGATAWLDRTAGRRELVIVSDFQRGTLDSEDVTGLATDITVRPIKIDVPAVGAGGSEATPVAEGDGTPLVPTLNLAPDHTEIRWLTPPVSTVTRAPETSTEVFASAAERPYADAALESAWRSATPLSHALAPSIAVVFPGAPERAALRSAARDLDQQWMFDLVARIRRDPVVAELTQGNVFATPAAGGTSNAPRLLLFLEPAGAVVHAALIAAAARNLRVLTPIDELEPETISTRELAAWTDPHARSVQTNETRRGVLADASDGRWFWGLAIVLLAIEALVRRPARPAIEIVHERAA